MRYMIRFEATAEAGTKVDHSPGGPGAAIGKILEIFKPESVYVSVFKRELFMVVSSDDPALLSEGAHAIALIAGGVPEVTPVLTGDEATAVLPGAIATAVQAARELGL
jgi:hypothetical protein